MPGVRENPPDAGQRTARRCESGAVPTRRPRPPAALWTWGSTASERAARYRCDDLVQGPRITLYRAVDVAAPASLTHRWVGQLRVAPYSHDLIDNLGRRSPRELAPGLGPPRVGQRAMSIFRIVDVPPDGGMTLLLMRPSGPTAPLTRPLWSPAAVTYRVSARPGGSRLVVKYVTADPGGTLGAALRLLLPPGDLMMMRRQLLTLAALAARDARRATN
jgi:hypothetical protein